MGPGCNVSAQGDVAGPAPSQVADVSYREIRQDNLNGYILYHTDFQVEVQVQRGRGTTTSRVGYQLNAAVRAAALDACELLRKLLPPLGIDGPATELEDAARVDAPQCDCQCLEYPSYQY